MKQETQDAQVETVEKEPINKISEDRLKNLKSLRDIGLQIRDSIGNLEIKKQELFVQHMGVKEKMEKEAEAALYEAGVSESEAKQYRIDLNTGEFTKG